VLARDRHREPFTIDSAAVKNVAIKNLDAALCDRADRGLWLARGSDLPHDRDIKRCGERFGDRSGDWSAASGHSDYDRVHQVALACAQREAFTGRPQVLET
jgi:hypothetical protein